MDADFEWDSRKAAENRRKHNVSFEDAVTAFADPLAVLSSIRTTPRPPSDAIFWSGGPHVAGSWWCPTPSAAPSFGSSAPGRQPAASGDSMKKASSRAKAAARRPAPRGAVHEEMRAEYDFRGGVRG